MFSSVSGINIESSEKNPKEGYKPYLLITS